MGSIQASFQTNFNGVLKTDELVMYYKMYPFFFGVCQQEIILEIILIFFCTNKLQGNIFH